MKLNCIAIDDDHNGIEIITDYISSIPDYHLTASFTNPLKALKYINSQSIIDILFLDIEMPEINGLELIKLIKHKIHKVIFTTGHQKYFIDAYQNEADGFLLKPFSLSKFKSTLQKLSFSQTEEGIEVKRNDDFFFAKSKREKNRMVKIKYDEIIAVESMQNYVSIYLVNKTVVSHFTMSKIKEILNQRNDIVQVHRSFLIALNFINEMEKNTLKMHGDLRITVSETYKDLVLKFIKGKNGHQ